VRDQNGKSIRVDNEKEFSHETDSDDGDDSFIGRFCA
jgi:hypothetical protein